MTNNEYKIIAWCVAIAALGLAVSSVWNDSFIVDEIPHVGAGYSYITKGDYRLNPEHPPLAKDLAGAALQLISVNQSVFDTKYWTTDINGQWNFGRSLIFQSGNNAGLMTRTAKLPEFIFFILIMYLVYHWAKELYGLKAGLVALFLTAFSPTIMAHSRLVTTDTPALFGALLGTYFFIKYLEKQDRGSFWLAVFAFGVAQLTKFSMVLLGPLFLILVIVWGIAQSYSSRETLYLFAKSLVIMALGILLIVWPIYGLHVRNYPPARQKADTTYNLGSYGNRHIADPVIWLSDKPYVRALAQFATGILMVNQRSIGGNTTYFLGEVRKEAWKSYFPIVYAIKEPLPFWGLVILATMALAAQVKNLKLKISGFKIWLKKYFVETAMFLWIAEYWALSINANLNIGIRHLLPTYGFVFILLAGQLSKIIENYKTKIKIVPILIFALLGWYFYENISVYPYYITYFNQLAGGPSGGYRYVVDSNLDWGQDLKRFATWVDQQKINKIQFDYFGWADPVYYLGDKYIWMSANTYKNGADFLRKNPNGGYIAVSASFYMGSRGNPDANYAWLDSYKPIAVIGNSIFVWHIAR